MVGPEASHSELDSISEELKAWFRAFAASPECIDVGFIGNTSGHYPANLGRIVDFDAFVFVERMDQVAGRPLADLRDRLIGECDARGVDFDLRVIDGPYKPAISQPRRPVFVVHLGVFTEALYLTSPPLKRWAWRKYRCEVEPERLARMAPSQQTLSDFIAGPKGLRKRRAAIESGSVEMTEWLLPSLAAVPILVTPEQGNFVECCFAYAANTARNHARAVGAVEADQLSNAEFFPWYDKTLFRSPDLLDLVAQKALSRDAGFGLPVGRARELALSYMRSLERALMADM